MLSKITLLFLAISAVYVSAAGGHGGGNQGHGGEGHGHDNVHYRFEYGVHDPHTHDVKTHYEHRDGKHVVGEYTLIEADGTKRIVKYKSGPHTGFEAVVEKVGHAQHPGHHGHGHGHGEGGGTSFLGTTHWSNQGHGGHW